MKSDSPEEGGCISRRHFLALGAAALAGCTTGSGGGSGMQATRTVDAGPVAGYATDGVYDRFRDQGFFVIRRQGKLIALSSICTHRKCKLEAESDRSFYCPCHGSTFDPNGKVTEGPAKRNLPELPTETNAAGHLLVRVPA